jgi:hypothetical protein
MSSREESQCPWRSSTYCAASTCVEVALTGDGVTLVRDSKDLSIPPLVFSDRAWGAFIRRIQSDEFA